MDSAIIVQDVGMEFTMYAEKIESLKEYVMKLLRRELSVKKFTALDGISFNVAKGDVFGIVGLNGSGKSTLLKIISGIMRPTTGAVSTKGTIAPLIELGAGFDLELTARENIFLNGAVLGFSKAFLQERFQEIVDFAELHQFIDVPLKNYSSGMVARIGFAIATVVQPDILIVDEILSVGDYLFQEKCEQRIQSMISSGTTILLVSHSIDQVARLCNRAVWLEKGRVRMVGAANDICAEYMGRPQG